MRLQLDEVRRLTGPNLLWDKAGAILDVFIEQIDKPQVISVWQQWMDKILLQFGWQQTHTYRLYHGGASLALSAPMDALYSACDLAELAWDCTVCQLMEQNLPDWQVRLNEIHTAYLKEQNPALLSLLNAAKFNGVTAISDDDEFSLGMGPAAQVWPIEQLPQPTELVWTRYTDIPRAFITGTNGKSTSVRLASEIARAAGYCAGVTSTDFIRVGDDIVDNGDYSGPGGARMLLRDLRTEIAFMEVARGGILRRGLPIPSVDSALITNVARDHLGQYGINRVDELAEVKFVVSKAVGPSGWLILNADNRLVVEQAKNVDKQICWFSEDKSNPLIQTHLQLNQPVVYCDNGILVFVDSQSQRHPVLAVSDIPMTLGGASRHNVQNALGVVGLCFALQLPISAIRQGLQTFGSDAKDNPGRGNLYEYNGATVMVDFAHNAHSMKAMIETAKRMTATRYIVMFSNAGDRSDQEIHDLTDAIESLHAHYYIVAEIDKYLRGRKSGELLDIVEKRLLSKEVNQQQIHRVDCPLDGAKVALNLAQPGDVILLFTLDQRQQVDQLLNQS